MTPKQERLELQLIRERLLEHSRQSAESGTVAD